MSTKIEVLPSLPMAITFKYLGPISSISLLSTSRTFLNSPLWETLSSTLSLNGIDQIKSLPFRSQVIFSVIDLKVICLNCGSLLDSIFGFFLYSNTCFDCKRNKTLHNFYDKTLHVPETDDEDEHRHYVEDFNIEWIDMPISGNYIMTAYGCTLG